MVSEARELGIDTLGAVPWGAQIRCFYHTKQDLLDIVVPYLRAGLENNELCIWIISEPVSQEEAEEALIQAVPDSAKYQTSHQIEIVSHLAWYAEMGAPEQEGFVDAWIDKLRHAVASGYDGIRLTCDVAWLSPAALKKLTCHQEEADSGLAQCRFVVLRTFQMLDIDISQVENFTSNRQFNLIHLHGRWALLGSSEPEQMEDIPRLLKSITQKVSDSVIVTDTEFKIIYVNEAAQKLFGYSADELIGKSRKILSVEPLNQEVERDIELTIASGRVWHGTFARRRKDGSTFLSESTVSPFFDKRGNIKAYVSSQGDVIYRQQAEAKQQAIVNTMLDGFWITNLEGRIIEVNDSYCRMTGYTREELLNMSIADIVAIRTPEEVARRIKDINEKGYGHFESQHKCKDGKIIDVEINAKFLNEEKGEFFVYIRDITEQKRAEEHQMIPFRKTSAGTLTRLQTRFIEESFEKFEDQEIIELLLSLVLTARKAKKLAKASLERFENLRGFLAAPPQELQQIGIDPACMFCIKLLHELPTKVLKQRIITRSIFQSSQDMFDYLYYSMRDLKHEIFKVIYLNNRSQIIDTADLFEGTHDFIHIRPREIVESAVNHQATGLIFVHNHPTGDPAPSRSDKQLTRDLVFVGNILQIKVLDHIIIGADSYFSFADDGLIQKYQDNFLNLKIRGVLASRALYRCSPALS
jgi:DNA repair protein RadC